VTSLTSAPTNRPSGVYSMGDIVVPTAVPGRVNLVFYEGDDLFLDLYAWDLDGYPIDLSDTQIRAQIRQRPGNGLLCEFQSYVDDDLVNLFHLYLPAAANVNMPTNAVWDAQMVWNGYITTLVAGTVTITKEVTR
jgi:hypothetical protein